MPCDLTPLGLAGGADDGEHGRPERDFGRAPCLALMWCVASSSICLLAGAGAAGSQSTGGQSQCSISGSLR
eukprot:6625113-Prymnesium_polylepis.1